MERILNKSGSLLIEVLLSVVILSTALTLVIQSMTASLRSIQYGAGYTTALILLDNQMCEWLRKETIRSGTREIKDLAESGTMYRYTAQAEPLDPAVDQGIERVEAAIEWRSGKKDNQIFVTTFLFTAFP